MLKRLVLAVCLPFLLAPAAEAANHGWYWGIEAGFDHPHDFSYVNSSSTTTETMKTGGAAMATLGTYVGSELRLEGELGYHIDDFKYWGNWNEISLIGNLIYDIPLASDLVASIGGGLGADLILTHNQSDVGFAYQILAGFAWSISTRTAVTLQYRYTSVSGPTFESGSGPMEYDNLDHQSLTIGLRFTS